MNDAGDAIDSSPDTAIISVLHAAHALEAKLENALSKAGLSSPKYSVLAALVEKGQPLSLGELASKLSCVRSNMTQLVDRLEADGFVRRVSDPEDRRSVKAAITETGLARHADGAREVAQIHKEFAASIDADARRELIRLLAAVP